MQPDSPELDLEVWLRRANSALIIASQAIPEGACIEDYCYSAQQAAEKALKALYIAHGLGFRYTHDIKDLLIGLQRLQIQIPTEINATVLLTRYACETRYPYESDVVTSEDLTQAIRHAALVVTWVEREIAGLTP